MLHLCIPLCLSLANNECTLLKQLGMSLDLVYDALSLFEKTANEVTVILINIII